MKRLLTFFATTAAWSCLGVAHSSAAIVTDDLEFNWDASTATPGTDWTSSAPAGNTSATWDTTGTDPVLGAVSSATTITQAYGFDGVGGDSIVSIGGVDQFAALAPDASFELWIRPTDLTGEHILFETGGNGRGLAIALNGDDVVVLFKEAGAPPDPSDVVLTSELSASDINDFIQIVVTTDGADSGPASHNLYVNALGTADASIVDASSSFAFGDFGGTDEAQLGTAGQVGGSDAGSSAGGSDDPIDNDETYSDFIGDIGILRIYDDVLSGEEVASNFNAVVPEPGSLALLVLGGACVMARRRSA
ncbi:MAG: PEP-CTERM sorting domain-containing protein [Planctomycetota bacterium]